MFPTRCTPRKLHTRTQCEISLTCQDYNHLLHGEQIPLRGDARRRVVLEFDNDLEDPMPVVEDPHEADIWDDFAEFMEEQERFCECVCVCAGMGVCVYLCVHVCVCACVLAPATLTFASS